MSDLQIDGDRPASPREDGRRDAYPGPREIVRQALRSLRDPYGLGTALYAVGLALAPPPGARMPLAAIAVLGLVAPVLRRRWWYWAVAFAVYVWFAWNAAPWVEWDNHRFLQIYVLAALTLVRVGPDPAEHLRTVARVLLALVFVFATGWKLATPSFMDGSFFAHTIATDARLGDVAEALGLQEADVTRDNRRAWRHTWRDPRNTPEPVDLDIADGVVTAGRVLAVATIVLEGSVAVAFLLPLRERRRRWRDGTLLVFVGATYPLAPVVGFGYTLLALGAFQSHLSTRWRTTLYLAALGFLIVLRYRGELIAALLPPA